MRRDLVRWYRRNGRDLPWRRTRDPYAILVSELMLQQTQVATVVPYYIEWLRRFPDFATLAAAAESDVLHAWQGLGYYARARNLHATAQTIVRHFGGVFPRDPAETGALPGLGRYTANAVATFAFDQAHPLVEANIARVLARLTNLQFPIDTAAGSTALWRLAGDLVPARAPALHHSALMDLGATVCLARQPKCDSCPVRAHCRAENPATLPLKKPRPAMKLLTEQHGFATRRGEVLLEQSAGRWRGMWILPRLTNAAPVTVPLHTAEFPFTHHRITLEVFQHPIAESATHRWFHRDELVSVPMPSPHRRALVALLPIPIRERTRPGGALSAASD